MLSYATAIALSFLTTVLLLNKSLLIHGFTEILNQQLKLYTSFSQTRSDVKMVQSLIPIWEVCFHLIHLLFFCVLLCVLHLLFFVFWSLGV